MFVWRILILAEKQRTSFARVYAYSIASIFLFHFVINVGMVIGLLPTIGIPLPFFSYGGSSLWFHYTPFIFIKLDANKLMSYKTKIKYKKKTPNEVLFLNVLKTIMKLCLVNLTVN